MKKTIEDRMAIAESALREIGKDRTQLHGALPSMTSTAARMAIKALEEMDAETRYTVNYSDGCYSVGDENNNCIAVFNCFPANSESYARSLHNGERYAREFCAKLNMEALPDDR